MTDDQQEPMTLINGHTIKLDDERSVWLGVTEFEGKTNFCFRFTNGVKDTDLILTPEAAMATERLIREHFEREVVLDKIVHYVSKWKEKDEQEDP